MGITQQQHVCGVGELDYENAADGYILCHSCGRIYKLTSKGWVANPPVAVVKPAYWKKNYKRK